MGKVYDIIMKRLKGKDSLTKDMFDAFASDIESDMKPLFKVSIPVVDTSKDRWLNNKDGVKVKVQGKNSYYVLIGPELQLFCMLYAAYGYKEGKRSAAGAFVSTIIMDEFKNLDAEGKKELSADIIRAAKVACTNRDPERRTPKMLQGWITERRWED